VQVVLFPQASITLQTRVATKVWPQVGFVTVLRIFKASIVAGVQLSEIIGTVKSQDSPHSRTSFWPQLMVGGVVSWKLIFCTQVEVFPQPSVADQVRRIIPRPVQLVLPKASVKLRLVTPLQVSLAVATPVLFVAGGTVQSSVISEGHLRDGGLVSATVTTCLQVADAPQESMACQVPVITVGQLPLVTALKVRVTGPGAPEASGHGLTGVGGSKVQLGPHSTVLLEAQLSENPHPLEGGLTRKTKLQDCGGVPGRETLTVIP